MKLLTCLASCFFAAFGASQTIQAPPQISPLFNVTLSLSAEQLGPIPIPGGSQVVREILSGAVTGAFEANITHGVVYPSLYQNETFQFVLGNIWGHTQDENGTEVPFFVSEEGVGGNRRFNRLTMNVGGHLANMSTAYIISTPSQINATTILTQAFLVS